MRNLKKCEQKKCGFLIMGMGCRACKCCKAEPYMVDDNCDACWNCSHDEGILRWDDNDEITTTIKGVQNEEEKEKIEVIARHG